MLEGLSTTHTSEPTAEEDADADPLSEGQTAAESFNDALDDIPDAERSTAEVLEAFLGTQPTRDLNRLIRGTARTAEELSRYEQSLQDLITNLNVTTAALAGESTNLRASISELPGRRRIPCMPCMRANGSWSELHTVTAPSGSSSIVTSHGRYVAGRWCCGQLNSTPPEIHGPARPTSAGLITSLR